MFLTITGRPGLYIALPTVLLAASLLIQARGEDGRVVADGGTGVPASPTGLEITTTPGSLGVSVDWDDTADATYYRVYSRMAGFGNKMNEGPRRSHLARA